MANVRVRPFSVFIGAKKFGEMHQAKFTINSGDEIQFGDGGAVGMSDGAETTSLSCTAIQPATRLMSIDLVDAIRNKKDLDVAIPIGTKIVMMPMRTSKAEFDTDQKTGRLEGMFDFIGLASQTQ